MAADHNISHNENAFIKSHVIYMLKVRFLGIPQIEFGADSVNIVLSGRVLALFVYLSVTRQPHSRSKLADLLWDNQSEQDGKKNLRYLLRDLRKAIGDYLVVDGHMVAFNLELPHWFDVTSFSIYLTPTLSTTVSQTDPRLLQELLNLYTGDFLAGFYIQDATNFERWMLAQRRQFHDALVYGLQLATQQHLDAGNYAEGLALNQYLLTLEPWREEAHRQHMILLAASGQRSAALMQYELCCQILEEELDVPPMNETTSLYTQIKSGMWFIERKSVEGFNQQRVAVRAYPKSAPDTTAKNHSIQDTSSAHTSALQVDLGTMPAMRYLIGRRRELYSLERWLDADACRLVAILGLSGQGKSALAAWLVQIHYNRLQERQNLVIDELPSDQQMDSNAVPGWPFPDANHQAATQTAEPVTKIVWRSLAQRPTCTTFLQDLVRQLNPSSTLTEHTGFDQLVTLLFGVLQQSRCLIVLDGVEAVLEDNSQEQIEAYEQLLGLLIERQHRSHILLTSRLRPSALPRERLQIDVPEINITGSDTTGSDAAARSLTLDGLTATDSEEFLTTLGLHAESAQYQQLYDMYAGTPRLLSRVVELIHELFDGDVDAFLQEDLPFLGNIGASLSRQLAQLSPLEHQLLHTLATAEAGLSRQVLWEGLSADITKTQFYNALRHLQRAQLIQQVQGQFMAARLPGIFLRKEK